MKNNIIVSVEDDYTSIYIWFSFNNQIIPLYFNSIKNNGSIINGSVYDKNKYIDIINKLFTDAKKFLSIDIKEISLCLDNFNVNIHNFETEIKLKDNLFNETIWQKDIFPNLQIKRNCDDQYNYAFDVVKWQIGDEIFEKIKKDYHGDTVKIIGKKYIINKLIFENFNDVFSALNVKIINFNTTLDLYKSNNELNELNILINKSNISITSIHNNHLMSNVICDNKGIDCLIELIRKETNIKTNEIVEYFNNIKFYKEHNDITIADKIDNEACEITRVKQSAIDEVFKKYASIILDLVIDKIEYYKKEKSTLITNINLISNSPIIQQIFNLFLILSKYQFNIIKPSEIMMYETKYMYCILNAKKDLKDLKTTN